MTDNFDDHECKHMIDHSDPSNRSELRDRAKKWLTSNGRNQIASMPVHDIAKLVFELETHQIELETQNEELCRAQLELAAARDQYSELYDNAPIGYRHFFIGQRLQLKTQPVCKGFGDRHT